MQKMRKFKVADATELATKYTDMVAFLVEEKTTTWIYEGKTKRKISESSIETVYVHEEWLKEFFETLKPILTKGQENESISTD